MTPISRLLKQRPRLCQSAFADTRDVNEAYLIVHNVLAAAFRPSGAVDADLGAAMAFALDLRSARLAGVPAPLTQRVQ